MSLLKENEIGKSAYAEQQQRSVQHLIKWHEPPAISLDEHGLIHDINASCERLFGYQRPDLLNNHISKLFSQLADVELIRDGQVNPSLNYRCRCGHFFQAQNQKGDIFSCNLSFVRVGNEEKRNFRMIVHPYGGWERGRFVYRKSES
jgi:PAS domain S-box-containing protein